jgi:hypothetical protein
MRDLYDNIGIVHLLDAADHVRTDVASKILDLAGFEGACVSVNVGAITGADGSNSLLAILQESDTTVGTDFEDVADANIVGEFALIDSTTEDQVTQMVGYVGTKRYIRVLLDYTGSGISASLISVDGIVGRAHSNPVTAPAAVAAT